MKNKIYPWLDKIYRNIINLYKSKRLHHAILFYSYYGFGFNVLVYEIVLFLMCYNKNGIKSCKKCKNCLLISSNSHPDFYCIQLNDGKKTIGIENIRYLIDILLNHSHQCGLKVIYISCVEKLTEESVNSLLKFLEYPTKNTYFFLECNNEFFLNFKIKSRCLIYRIKIPKKEEIFIWLKKEMINISSFDIKLAINFSYGIPLRILNLLKKENWNKRKFFYDFLFKCLLNKNILDFFFQLNQFDFINRIEWIVILLLDVFKYKIQVNNLIINKDQLNLISYLGNITSDFSLFNSLSKWNKCYYILNCKNNMNKEMQLMSCLSFWQKILFEKD